MPDNSNSNHPRRRRGNVVQFPETGRARRRILRKSEDPRLRLAAVFASVSGWLFTLALVLFLITNYRLLLPDSLHRLFSNLATGLQITSSDAATIEYASGSMLDAELFGGGLAYVDSDTLYISKPNGLNQLALQLSYSNPAIEVSDSLILAFDQGGRTASLSNALTSLCEVKTESPILSASIGENGGFVLVTDESGYKTAVAVYNNNGAQVFKWYSAEYYILAAALSPDGNYLAVLGFQQAGVELKSELLFWRIGKEEAEARFELGSSLGYDVEFMNSSTAAVMTDHGAYLVTRKGVLLGQLELSPSDLIGYIFSDRGILVASNAYQGAARAQLRLLSTNGTLSEEPLYISSEIQHISADGSMLGVLTTDGLHVYSLSLWDEIWSNRTVTGARGLRMDSSGTAYVLYGSDCRIFQR